MKKVKGIRSKDLTELARNGSLFYTLKILLIVNPVNLDTCLNELPSSSFKYLKIPVCICERTWIYQEYQ